MKNKIAQLLMFIGLTVGLTIFAQAQVGAKYTANIPFDFIVGQKSFKAGDYSINFGLQSDPNKFIIKSVDGKYASIVALTVPKEGKSSEEATLVFNISNDLYYLAEVNTYQTSLELPDSHSKKKDKRPEKRVEVALAR